MASLTEMHYDGQSPLDLRVRRDRPDDERFVPKGSSSCAFEASGGFVEETDKLRRSLVTRNVALTTWLNNRDKQEETEYNFNPETFSYKFNAEKELCLRRLAEDTNGIHDGFYNFIKQEKGCIDCKSNAVHFPFTAERELYADDAEDLHITVKQETETEESYFQPSGEKFPFADDFRSKVEENSSEDEDNLIIDVSFEEKSPSKKRLDRSDSNCSTNSNSSCTSDTAEDVKAFLRSFSSPYKTHKCSKCKVRFTDLHSLFEHLDGHVSRNPGERFLKCPVCMKRFQKIMGIHAHIRKMHLGRMEFICQYCQSPFKFNLHLQKHESSCRKRKKTEIGEGAEYNDS